MFNGLKRGIVICACAALAVSCMDYGPIEKEDFEIDNIGSGDEVTGKGLFITNEGNFMYGNASLSYYDPEKKHVENEVFARANYNRGIQMYRFPNSDVQKSVIFEGIKKRLKIV